MTSRDTQKNGRSAVLDIVRMAAIVLVLLRHGISVPEFETPESGVSLYIYHLCANGWLGVDLFFVLSGHLLTKQILRDSSTGNFSRARFLRRRAIRTLPPFLLMLFASWFGLLGLSDAAQGAGRDYLALMYSLMLVSDYFPPPVLVVFWSLAVEEKFYLLMALFIPILIRRSRLTVIILMSAVITLVVVSRYLIYDPDSIDSYADFFWQYRAPSHYAGVGIVIGVVTGFISDQMPKSKHYPHTLTAAILTGVAITVLAVFPWTKEQYWHASLLVIPAFSILAGAIILLAPDAIDPRPGAQWAGRISRNIANAAYSLYLVHFPIAWFLAKALRPADAELLVQALFWCAYLLGTALIGGIFFRLIEKPCVEISRRLPATG